MYWPHRERADAASAYVILACCRRLSQGFRPEPAGWSGPQSRLGKYVRTRVSLPESCFVFASVCADNVPPPISPVSKGAIAAQLQLLKTAARIGGRTGIKTSCFATSQRQRGTMPNAQARTCNSIVVSRPVQ